VVNGDRASSKEDQGKRKTGCSKGELESVIARQPIVQMHLPDRDDQVHADGEGCGSSEESRQYKYSAQELGERRDIAGPGGQPQAGHEISVVMETAEDFVRAVYRHNGTQNNAYHKKRKWLQAFEVAHGSSGQRHQITAETRRPVKSQQQNDCVAAQLLVTFFRPPRESFMVSESSAGSTSLTGAFFHFRDWQKNKFSSAVPRRRLTIHDLHDPVFARSSGVGLFRISAW
jgi:hypothetical protein